MSPWKILSRYIARQFLLWFTSIFLAMAGIVFLLDYIELIRRGGSRGEATLLVLLQMAALKQPYMAQQILPFAILFGTMMAFWRMTRGNELVVARAAGLSVWQFLTPAVSCALVIGIVAVTLFNPVASVMQAGYESLENRVLRSSGDQLSLTRSGFWLRQSDDNGNHSIIHAERVGSGDVTLEDVVILFFNDDNRLESRLDAHEASLKDGYWTVRNGTRWTPEVPSAPFQTMTVPTNLSPNKIQESFASPESMSFWELPGFIKLLRESGFSTQRHRLYYNALLARPFLFVAMVLIAATFSLRMHRRGGATMMICGGIAAGFLLYFLSNVVFALGLSSTIPVILAAWTPTGVSWLLGSALLLHLEDG